MTKSDYEKIQLFHTYLEARIKRKSEERSKPDTSSRIMDLLKTERGEAQIILNYFDDTFGFDEHQ